MKSRCDIVQLIVRAQVDRARNAGMKGLVDKDIPSGSSFDFGLICQLSIPIITICAFICLNIFLSLFDLIFQWMFFIKICIPFPKRSES